MKKLLAFALATMAAVVLASSAQAAPSCAMNRNKSDDGSFKCKVESERKLKIDTNATANVTTNTTASSNVGGNSISAGEDVSGATINGGTALTDIVVEEDVNSLDLEYMGLPDGGSPSVEINDNEGDDPEYKAKVKEESKEKVEDTSNATVNATQSLSSNGGGNSVSATDDNTGSTIGGSNATTSSKVTRFVNFRTILRN